MAVDAMLLRNVNLDRPHSILRMHGNKTSSQRHAGWMVRSKIESDRKSQGIKSDFPATAAVSYYYHTSTFPSLFAKLQSDQNALKQTNKLEMHSEPRSSRPSTDSKLLHSKQERKNSNRFIDHDNSQSRAQNQFRFIWSSINESNYSNNENSDANKNLTKLDRKSQQLFQENKTNIGDSYRDNHQAIKEETVKSKRIQELPESSREATKFPNRFVKYPAKPVVSKSFVQRRYRAPSRDGRLRSLSFAHFDVTALNNLKTGRGRSSITSKPVTGVLTNKQLFPSPNKTLFNYKDAPLSSARPWTSVKPDSYFYAKNRIKQSRRELAKANNKLGSISCQDDAQHSQIIPQRRKKQSVRPKTNHVRFREIISDEKMDKLPNIINSEAVEAQNLTESNLLKRTSSLSHDDVKAHQSNTETLKNNGTDANASFEMSSLAKANSDPKKLEQTDEPTGRLSLDQLRLRDRNYRTRTTDFLSTDQLIIRESVEKVLKWLRTLPKHFDAIHHVSTPAQQDY